MYTSRRQSVALTTHLALLSLPSAACASNLAKNELRNRSRNPLVLFTSITQGWEDEERPLEFEDPNARPDDQFRKRHVRQMVEESVAALPEHHREVFVLRELEGRSYEEISEITHCNLGTV